MRKHIAIIIASLALFTGQAHAQRCLPKMQGIEVRANLADGFNPGGNDGGYSFGASLSTYTKKGNKWVFGGEYLLKNNPYKDTAIPVAQFTAEGGYYFNKKLKNARVQSGMTQENVAEKINVSRQTISNWENEKSYPDIISVIELSNLYSISLDVLLKGDEKMIEHLEESTNVVKSNQKMIWAIIVNIIVVALLITLNMFIPDNRYFLVGIFCLMVITSSALLYQIIKKF